MNEPPPQSYSPSYISELIENHLKEGQILEAVAIFEDPKHELVIKNGSWDLIPVVTKFLSTEIKVNNLNLSLCCQQLLEIISLKCNPEEALLQIIEEIEETHEDFKLLCLLEATKNIIKRIPVKKINSIAWSFNAIQGYLNKLPLPENFIPSCDDDDSSACSRIVQLYQDLIPFYNHFVDEYSEIKEYKAVYKKLLAKFLIQLLDKPLSHLDFDIERNNDIVELILDQMFRIMHDPFLFLDRKAFNNEFEVPSNLGTAVLFYLIMSQEKWSLKIPKVYDPVYIFQHSLWLVTSLLHENNKFCISRGLYIADRILKLVKNSTLSSSLLDSTDHNHFCVHLTNVVIFNPNEHFRNNGFQLLQIYINLFETKGQYLIIYNLVNTVNHSGLIGFLITRYKELVVNEMSKDIETLSEYCSGEKLWNILQKFCYLHKEEESDLIELSDQIISCLNFLRYLVLRDEGNITGIWNYISRLEKTFLEPLKKGIISSQSHFNSQLQVLQSEKHDPEEASKVSVTITGQTLAHMPVTEQISAVNASLIALDVMDSLLCRLNECKELSGKKTYSLIHKKQ